VVEFLPLGMDLLFVGSKNEFRFSKKKIFDKNEVKIG
jgi:hypothetical protein